jgi:hypothetical protein
MRAEDTRKSNRPYGIKPSGYLAQRDKTSPIGREIEKSSIGEMYILPNWGQFAEISRRMGCHVCKAIL